MPRHEPYRLPASEKLRTLNLYVQLGSLDAAGECLGVSGAAINDRLRRMGVRVRPPGTSDFTVTDMNKDREISRLRLRLHVQAQKERAHGESR